MDGTVGEGGGDSVFEVVFGRARAGGVDGDVAIVDAAEVEGFEGAVFGGEDGGLGGGIGVGEGGGALGGV